MSDSMVLRAVVPEAAALPPSGSLEPRWLRFAAGRVAAALRAVADCAAAHFPEAVEASDRDLERLSRRQHPLDVVGQQRAEVLRRVGRF